MQFFAIFRNFMLFHAIMGYFLATKTIKVIFSCIISRIKFHDFSVPLKLNKFKNQLNVNNKRETANEFI